MIVKQKNLRVFHINIDDKDVFIEYFNKNRVLLKEFFLLVEGQVNDEVIKLLDDAGICFKDISSCNLKLSSVKKEIETVKKEDVKEKVEEKIKSLSKENLRMFDRPIRSGEEINEDLPVVVFGRINSGAKLFSTQSVSVYGIIDGLVQCDGDYIVLNGIGSHGNLIFNGEIIDKESLKKDVLQKITINNSKVKVKEI